MDPAVITVTHSPHTTLSLPLLKCFPDPRQPLTVACRSPVAGPRPTGVTGHADCLVDVSPQAYPVKDGYQGAESALEPSGFLRDNHPVVGVKHRRLMSSLPSCLSLIRSLCHQPLYPVPDDRVHCHIEKYPSIIKTFGNFKNDTQD